MPCEKLRFHRGFLRFLSKIFEDTFIDARMFMEKSTMQVKSNKIYIDYLDYTVSESFGLDKAVDRLRFDLLLFSEEILCMSVPACVKLDSTTKILMKLTPFWDNGKIRLILDRKHRNNPWNYFNNRKRVLERGFSEEQLVNHFEYAAYNSSHTDFFYNVFIKEILHSKHDLYIGKVFDTDETFRQSVITQANDACSSICSKLSVTEAIHMGKIFNDLIFIAEDRKSLFQRSAVEMRLQEECGASPFEIKIVSTILDKGFAYANGVSSYAAPLSLISNRLTGNTLINILKSADSELYELIHSLDWIAVYRLSINDTWLDFIDHLNKLLILYQDSAKHKNTIFSPIQLGCSVITFELVKKLYETAMDSLQKELLKAGAVIIDVLNLKEYSDKTLEHYLSVKSDYWDVIKEINELIPALKVVIRSLDRKYKDSTIILKQRGFIVNLYDNK